MSRKNLADEAGTTASSIYRYERLGRIPDAEAMQGLVKATNGQVTPNDFYHITLPSMGSKGIVTHKN
jgi:transcriptional regulator with XRE-family HTH domain